MVAFQDLIPHRRRERRRYRHAKLRRAVYAGSRTVERLEERQLLSAWYVATTGQATNPGTLQQPFATIQEAANVAQPGDTVFIQGGTYHETVVPPTSGTPGAPITFEPYNHESVTIDGADPVTGWTSYSGDIYQAPQSWDLGEGYNQVFVDGTMVNEARYPSSSANVSSPTWAKATSVSVTQSSTGLSTVIIYNSALNQAAGTWVGAIAHIATGAEWVDQTGLITASSPGSITVSYQQETSYQVPQAGNRFYIVGAMAALDSAGEWYRNPKTGTLYLWDPAGDSPANHTVEAKARQYGFELSGQSYIDVQGINLFACTVNTDANSTHDQLNGLTATYVSQATGLGSDQMDPWSAQYHPHTTGIILNGQFNIVENSTIAFSSGDGVFLGGSNNTVQNCVIHDVDYEAGDEAGVTAMGSDEVVQYNTIYNTGRSGIVIRFTTDSQILHNDVYNVGLQMTDLGGIYTWGTDGEGTTIAYNVVDNIHTPGYGGAGIYLDNSSQDYIVDHNLVYNCDFGLKLNPPSTNNTIVNNTFEGTQYGLESSGDESMTGCIIENDIFGAATMFGPGLTQSHNLSSMTNPLFVNTTAGNYQLQSTSPAINAGMVAAPYTNGYLGTEPDIGAYEYGVAPFQSGIVATPTLGISGTGSVNAGSLYTLTLGPVSDQSAAPSQYLVHWGDGTTTSTTTLGPITHVYTSSGVEAISVDLTDALGTWPGAGTTSVVVNPGIALGGNATANAHGSYTLSLGAFSDPSFIVSQYTVHWGDGSTSAYSAGGPVTHLFTTAGPDTITVDLTGSTGTYTAAGTLSLTVDPSPTIALTGSATANAGGSYLLNLGAVTDPGYTVSQYTVNWGDGTASAYSAGGVVAHTFNAAGPDTITVDLTDSTGTYGGAGSLALTVNPAPTLQLAGNANANVGGSYSLNLGAVADPGYAVSQYAVNWGDGSTNVYNAGGIATHTFNTAGPDAITVNLTDGTGSYTAAGTLAVTVNPAPTITISGNASAATGQPYLLNLGAVSDPGYAVSEYAVHWGDGTTSSYLVGGTVAHVYSAVGQETITVDLTDATGTYAAAGSLGLSVNFAPTIVLSGNADANVHGVYTLNLGAVTDPGNTVSQYTVHWGDGSTSSYLTASAVAHTFTSLGFKAITVDLTDGTGTYSSAGTLEVAVNPAPTIALTGNADANAGGTYTLDLGAVTDPGYAISQYTVHWGDGSTNSYAAGGALTHTYSSAAQEAVTVDLTDATGTFAAAGSKSVTVNAAPKISLGGLSSTTVGAAYSLTLGAITDPGYTVTQYTVHWGDGTSSVYTAGGAVTHAYSAATTAAITVDVTDASGTFTKAGSLNLSVVNAATTNSATQLFTSNIDIGSPTIAGSASYSNGTYTVTGEGSDIWNSSDQFHYDSKTVSGNTTIAAKVASVTNTNVWAKAGVMIRNGTAANAAFADVVVAPGGYVAFQYRAKAGGTCTQYVVTGKTIPQYVKLVRSGNSFTAYYSSNGTAWTQLGSSVSITMNTVVNTGLAVTSVNTAKACTATFSNVTVS